MITATDVRIAAGKQSYYVIDEIIGEKLMPMFKRSTTGAGAIVVPVLDITNGYGIQQELFVSQMKLRGFEVLVFDNPIKYYIKFE